MIRSLHGVVAQESRVKSQQEATSINSRLHDVNRAAKALLANQKTDKDKGKERKGRQREETRRRRERERGGEGGRRRGASSNIIARE